MQSFGPYVVTGRLGAGGMGEVFAAEHPAHQLKVAVKRLDHASIADVTREVHALAAIDHPNVVQIIDHGTSPEGAWIAMERGHRSLAEAPPRSQRDVRDALVEVLEGLAHVHAHHIIHRDLKPSNLLWVDTEHGRRIKIADFGIAATRTSDARMQGTPKFMGPERFSGAAPPHSPATDLYAVGKMAELWLGQPDAAWADWIGWLCAPVPEHRPCSAAHARAAIPGSDPGQGVVAPMVSADPTMTATADVASTAALPTGAAKAVPPAPPLPERPQATLSRAILRPVGLFRLRPTPLRGRVDEQDRLWQALRAAEGQTQICVISGPSGVGSSRLAQWLAVQAHRHGRAVFRADTTSEVPAFAQLVLDATGTAGVPAEARPALWRRWCYHHGLPEGSAGVMHALAQVTGRAFGSPLQAAHALLPVLGARGPGAVVWLDGPLTDDARALVQAARDKTAPLCVVLSTVDGTDAEHDHRVALHALPESEWEALARSWLQLEPGTARILAGLGGGNPRLTEQVLQSWLDADALDASPRGYRLRDEGVMPSSIVAAMESRVQRLVAECGAEERQALSLLARLGLRSRWDTVQRVVQQAGLAVPVAAIDALERAALAQRREGELRFASEPLRQALEQLSDDGVVLHRVIAETLGEDQPGARGRHWLLAGEPERAQPLLYRAVEQANFSLRFGEAEAWLRLLQRANAARPDVDPSAQADLLAAQLARQQGDSDRAVALIDSVLARTGVAQRTRAQAHHLRSLLHTQLGEADLALEQVALALDAAPDFASAHLAAVLVHLASSRFEAAEDAARAGLRVAEPGTVVHAELLRTLGQSQWRRGLPEAQATIRQATEAAQRSGDRVTELLCWTELGAIYQTQCDFPAALAAYDEALALCAPGSLHHTVVDVNRVTVAELTGGQEGLLVRALELRRKLRVAKFAEQAAYASVAIWTLSPVEERGHAYQEMREGLDRYGLVDPDFVLLAEQAARRWQAEGDAEHAELALEFAAAQRAAGAKPAVLV